MEAPDITNFKLVDDFELFFDKGILRRKINLFMGSRKYDLCYKISPKLYAFLSLIIEPLKAGKINEAYECVSDYIIYDSFIKTIKKLSELGFNADFEKASLTPKKFDESELTMIWNCQEMCSQKTPKI